MGKKYDARKMTELCDTIRYVVEKYASHAEMLENEYEIYNSNNTYRGEAADASKEFVYKGQGRLTKEQVRVLTRISRKFNETQNSFGSMVDSSPNAKIDTDVIEYDKRYFERHKESFEERAYKLERVTREMADKFERFGYITSISCDRARYGFEDMCGYSGFMNKCIRKFEEFDEGVTSHLKSSGIDSYMYDLEKDTKATMNALDGMTVYNPDVKKITVTPIAQMAAKMMYSAGLTASPKASITEGEKLLKLLRLEHSANLPVDANIIKTATDYALQMCPSKEGMLAIQNCSNAMLAADGQTLKAIADIAALFMTGAATLVSEIAPFVPPILAGMLIGAGIALFVRIIGEIVNTFCPLVTPRDKEENANIIDIPPTEDKKPIIEKPSSTPQDKPSVTDIPSGDVEEKEIGRDIMPKSPIENDRPKIYLEKGDTLEGAGEVEKNYDPEIILPSKPHRNGTEGHWETILDEVENMKQSGDYVKIYVNKGLSNEIPGANPNRRPDIMGVRQDGTIDQVEVPSKTDNPKELIDRMKANQDIIGKERAGTIRIRNIDIGGD